MNGLKNPVQTYTFQMNYNWREEMDSQEEDIDYIEEDFTESDSEERYYFEYKDNYDEVMRDLLIVSTIFKKISVFKYFL